MHIGVPKETKVHEYRVGMTPESVRELVEDGHTVTVETGAGAGINASDTDYRSAGAVIADGPGDVFAVADMIVKVKEPQAGERSACSQAQSADDASPVGHFEPSADIGEVGLQDIRECLRAHRRGDGGHGLRRQLDRAGRAAGLHAVAR